MPYSSIIYRVDIIASQQQDNFVGDYDALITASLKNIYENSPKAALVIDQWLADNPTKNIEIRYSAGSAGMLWSSGGSGKIEFDPSVATFAYYISTKGNVIRAGYDAILALR